MKFLSRIMFIISIWLFSSTYLFGKYVTKSLLVLNDVKIVVQIVLMKTKFYFELFSYPINNSSSAGI